MNVFRLQMKSPRFSRNDNLTVKTAQPSRPPQCWNYYRVVFKLTLSHSCFQGYAEFRVEQFSLFISIKIFSSPICQSQPQQTQHNCYLLLSQLYCPHYSFIQWTMIRITLYRKLSFDWFGYYFTVGPDENETQPRVHQFQLSVWPSWGFQNTPNLQSSDYFEPSYGTSKKAMFWDYWRFTCILK